MKEHCTSDDMHSWRIVSTEMKAWLIEGSDEEGRAINSYQPLSSNDV